MEDFESLVDPNKEEGDLVIGGMDETELQTFYKFIMGESLEPPEVLSKMMNNLITKLSMGLGYNVVNNIGRQSKLSKFLAEAESRLYNPDSIDNLEDKELASRYKQASMTLNNLLEFQRKFIVQNKETLKTENTPQEKLMNKIMTLSPDKVAKIMQAIEDMDKGSTEDRPAEQVLEEEFEDVSTEETTESTGDAE